jgi:hypothetical protein
LNAFSLPLPYTCASTALVALSLVGCTFSRLQHACVLFGTAAVGSTITVLGIDCFIVDAHLKEFYIYLLGINVLPERITYFPHTTGIRVELAVIGALFLVSIAFQMRFYQSMLKKHKERKADERAQQEQADLEAARTQKLSGLSLKDWEAKHGRGSALTLLEKCDGDYLPTLVAGAHSPSPPPQSSAPLSAKWADYLKSRSISVDTGKPRRAYAERRLSVNPSGGASVSDQTPKSQAFVARPSSAQVLRLESWTPPTASSGSSPEPHNDVQIWRAASPAEATDLVQTRPSRASMTMTRTSSQPLSLAFTGSGEADRATTGQVRRSSTLLNLGPEDMPNARGQYVRPGMAPRRSTGGIASQTQEERVIISGWRRKDSSHEIRHTVRTPSPGPVKIMDLDELEDRKKRRLSQ